MFAAVLARSRAAALAEEPYCLLPELQFARAAILRLTPLSAVETRGGLLTTIIGASGSGKSSLIRHCLRDASKARRRRSFLLLNPSDWDRPLHDEDDAAWDYWTRSFPQVDLVICDDLDQTMHSSKAADRVARWFDALLARQRRVLVTAARAPGHEGSWSPRLVSRLRGGLMAYIRTLSDTSRERYLKWAAGAHDLTLSEVVLQWLARESAGSLRQLHAQMQRLTLAFPRHSQLADLEGVQRVLNPTPRPTRLSLAVITQHVAEEFGLPAQELRGTTRIQAIRVPRQCAMHLAHQVGGWPMSEIGRFFGRRTHTSVSYSCRKFAEHLGEQPSLRERLQRLQTRLTSLSGKEAG